MKSMLEVILDFYCSCTKVSQTKQLRRTHIYYLTIWLIRGLTQIFPDQDQNVSSFVFLSEGSRVQFVLVFSSFYWLPAFLGLECPSYIFNTCNTVTLDLSCIVTFFPLTISRNQFSLKNTCDYISSSLIIQGNLLVSVSLTLITS